MKIISARKLPNKKVINENLGDTHSGLHVALSNVDRGMESLGLSPAEMGNNTLAGNTQKAEGQRDIKILFGKTLSDIQNNTNCVELSLDGFIYRRQGGKFWIGDQNALGVWKALTFDLKGVVAEPKIGDAYEALDVKDQGVSSKGHVDGTYKFCMFTLLKYARSRN